MRIKAVEGIKAYNRSADLSGLRLCVSAYTYIYFTYLYLGLSVCAFVNESRQPFCGHQMAASVVLFGYRYPRNFLNFF